MPSFKKDDVVVCRRRPLGSSLTAGRFYTVRAVSSGGNLLLEDDNDRRTLVSSCDFDPRPEPAPVGLDWVKSRYQTDPAARPLLDDMLRAVYGVAPVERTTFTFEPLSDF